MKTQNPLTRILVHAAAAVIAIAVASPAKAADTIVVFGDFNNDGFEDVAEVISPTTITVSLANWDGSYTVTAILTPPKNQQIFYVYVYDRDGDGNLDVYAFSPGTGTSYYTFTWLGNGDGTFGSPRTRKWSSPKGHIGFF